MPEQRILDLPDGSTMDITGASDEQIRAAVGNYMAKSKPAAMSVPPVNPDTGTAAMGQTMGAGDYAALLAKEMGPDLAMVGATMLPGIREATAPLWVARLGRYAKVAEKLYPAATRVAAAGLGRATGTAAGQAAGIATGAEWAPQTAGQVVKEQATSGAIGAAQQATFGELVPNVITKAAHATITAESLPSKLEAFGKVQRYRNVQAAEKEVARAQEAKATQMAKESAEAARIHAIDEARASSEKIVAEIGPKYGPNQMQDLSGRLNQEIKAGLEVERKAKYGLLDEIAFANKEAGSEVVSDGSKVVNKIIEIERRKPRGEGVFRLLTLPEPGVTPITSAAKKTVSKIQEAETGLIAGGERAAVGDADEAMADVAQALKALKDAQKGYGEVPLGVSLMARGTASRALANSATSEELKGILREIMPDLDNMNRVGLAKLDPKLVGMYEEAKHFWHQSAVIEDRVLYKLFKDGRSVKPLADYIEENAPRNAERVRDVLRRTGDAEQYWPAVQRTKLSEMLMGRNGEVDLARLGQKLDDFGTTLPRLLRDAEGKIDPAMQQRVAELRKLSDTYNKLMEKAPLEVSEKMQRLDAVLGRKEEELAAAIKGGPGATRNFLQYVTSPHVLSGIALGRVFGWGPAAFGGVASAAIGEMSGSAAVKLVKLAENPQALAQFTRQLEQYAQTGKATNLLNLKRIWDAGMKSHSTWEQAIADLGSSNFAGMMEPSHSTSAPPAR